MKLGEVNWVKDKIIKYTIITLNAEPDKQDQ